MCDLLPPVALCVVCIAALPRRVAPGTHLHHQVDFTAFRSHLELGPCRLFGYLAGAMNILTVERSMGSVKC